MTESYNPKGVPVGYIHTAQSMVNTFGGGLNGGYTDEYAYEEIQEKVPERRLLWAMLWRTVNDVLWKDCEVKEPGRVKRHLRKYTSLERKTQVYRDRREAVKYILSRRKDVFSFRWLCETLNLDPNKVRSGILRAYKKGEKIHGRRDDIQNRFGDEKMWERAKSSS